MIIIKVTITCKLQFYQRLSSPERSRDIRCAFPRQIVGGTSQIPGLPSYATGKTVQEILQSKDIIITTKTVQGIVTYDNYHWNFTINTVYGMKCAH